MTKIDTYVARLTAKRVEQATADTLGDCWDCSMYVQPDGIAMGDYYHTYEHLEMHIQEKYYPGSLLLNAWRENGTGSNPSSIAEVKAALKKYLTKRLVASGDPQGPGGLEGVTA